MDGLGRSCTFTRQIRSYWRRIFRGSEHFTDLSILHMSCVAYLVLLSFANQVFLRGNSISHLLWLFSVFSSIFLLFLFPFLPMSASASDWSAGASTSRSADRLMDTPTDSPISHKWLHLRVWHLSKLPMGRGDVDEWR